MINEEEYQRIRLFLIVDVLNIDKELEQLPMVLLQAIEHRARSAHWVDKLKANHDILKAVTVDRMSEELVNGKPPSSASITAKLPAVEEIAASVEQVREAALELSLWTGMVDGLRQKGYSLNSLSDLTIAGYTATASTYDRDKARMAQARDGRAEERHSRRRAID